VGFPQGMSRSPLDPATRYYNNRHCCVDTMLLVVQRFIGVTLVWQLLFQVISREPVKYLSSQRLDILLPTLDTL